MKEPRIWSAKKGLKKVNSVDILVRRKADKPLKRSRSLKIKKAISTPKKVETPKKNVKILSPDSRIEIMGSPESKRYNSTRKIDFNN
ncbi:hypothetical protein EHEL_071140 [Encephalitozoon hellem ATCC 50504]|uniref:Uncharacterized protein n=1 Tax=Encephalitozoon hellem TaxID=27973 RepID=A0A9Q9C3Q0_ENCHE|nr:uncharacterized protein EHEL_071140 [Encephalitozoon hellem ATCC 50504]AFM98640.1 hypothetical protein EHEL_071140 [Encephalitozoon hellem ATCC 50504]UTX43589.1 hypothetical protein GPU96_07g13500 [Encephalitozoon hellem]WEL39064.1 hypothetical protein PFJ87_07g01420 [Encephalitozoon hellem]|eukprot:XP_003887621.1 hypothetical protein EHEL_071140 [Encephalitozoon hellem ATCC 50504]